MNFPAGMRLGVLHRTLVSVTPFLVLAVLACGSTEDEPSRPGSVATVRSAADSKADPVTRPSAAKTPPGARWEEVAIWGKGADGLRFDGPNGIAIDADDHVYTTEFRGHRVRKFTPEGGPSCRVGRTWRGIFKKCVTSQAVYPLSEQHGLEAQERR